SVSQRCPAGDAGYQPTARVAGQAVHPVPATAADAASRCVLGVGPTGCRHRAWPGGDPAIPGGGHGLHTATGFLLRVLRQRDDFDVCADGGAWPWMMSR